MCSTKVVYLFLTRHQACIQQIPGVSPTNPYITIAPLAVVLLASGVKESQEDLVSRIHQSIETYLIPA